MKFASLLLVLFSAAASNTASSDPVLLDFHAEWCGPCRQMRPAVAQLARNGLPIKSIDIDHSPDLREKYGVERVPTFIVVDHSGKELGRTEGSQAASQLAQFYQAARAKARPPANSRAHVTGVEDEADDEAVETDHRGDDQAVDDRDARPEEEEEEETRERAPFRNPRPWQTVVRIRVLAPGSVGFGSGTVIHSTADEAIVLTCAHIFKLDGMRQTTPDRFPRKIMVDLFDGKLHGERPAQVHFVESVQGWAVDYDFTLDVGLIRIKTDRRLPSARVVPAHWEPKARMKMLTVGCSEGNDATAWHTLIVNPQMRGLSGNNAYQAIECMIAPKQGRSGGGLFTTDGYVAGVCNFAEPRGDHGLYATPRSVYSILDRNELAALYAPVSGGSGTLLADRGPRTRSRAGSRIAIARGQSPEGPEPDRSAARPGDVTVPEPEILGIQPPVVARRTASTGGSARRKDWRPSHTSPVPEPKLAKIESEVTEQPTDMNVDPEVDHDKFSRFDDDQADAGAQINHEDLHVELKKPVAEGSRSRWRAVRSPEGKPISSDRDE